MARAFEEEGFSVSLNDPYAGGYITAHYGALLARAGKIAVQMGKLLPSRSPVLDNRRPYISPAASRTSPTGNTTRYELSWLLYASDERISELVAMKDSAPSNYPVLDIRCPYTFWSSSHITRYSLSALL